MKTDHEMGFTLIELMVTLAVAAIVLTVAVPSFQDLVRNNRLATQANQLVSALNLARSEAVKRGVRVTVCKTDAPDAAEPSCSATANWQQGFIVFVDNTHLAGNSKGVIDEPDERIRVFGALTGSTLQGGDNFAEGISYLASGVSEGIKADGAKGLADGTFTLCSSGEGRAIMIGPTGRVRVAAEVNEC
jgi:type IV fimbrial biogenesis protein FimT